MTMPSGQTDARDYMKAFIASAGDALQTMAMQATE